MSKMFFAFPYCPWYDLSVLKQGQVDCMHLFVGVTDNDWFDFLSAQEPEDVNFWKPGGGAFAALSQIVLVLCTFKRPRNSISG